MHTTPSDLGFAFGALLSEIVADLVGLAAAIHLVAALTLLSGVVVAITMRKQRFAALPA